MKRVAACYLLASCTFLLVFSVYTVVEQCADVEPSDLGLVLVFWVLPCLAGLYVVLANGLHRRKRTEEATESS
jgi:hypothetical protein